MAAATEWLNALAAEPSDLSEEARARAAPSICRASSSRGADWPRTTRPRRTSGRRCSAAGRAVVSGRAGLGRAGRARGAGRPLPHRRRARTGSRSGHLRHRVQARVRARPAPGPASSPTTAGDSGRLDRPRSRLDGGLAHRGEAHAGDRGCRGAVGVSGRRHPDGREVRGAEVSAKGGSLSFTLRGRIESRLAAALAPLLAACGLAAAVTEWWPLALAGTMIGVGPRLRGRPRPAARLPARLVVASARRRRARRRSWASSTRSGSRPLSSSRSRSSPAPGSSI